MALNGLISAEVPLRIYSLTQSLTLPYHLIIVKSHADIFRRRVGIGSAIGHVCLSVRPSVRLTVCLQCEQANCKGCGRVSMKVSAATVFGERNTWSKIYERYGSES